MLEYYEQFNQGCGQSNTWVYSIKRERVKLEIKLNHKGPKGIL
jgi:hypothetical protein